MSSASRKNKPAARAAETVKCEAATDAADHAAFAKEFRQCATRLDRNMKLVSRAAEKFLRLAPTYPWPDYDPPAGIMVVAFERMRFAVPRDKMAELMRIPMKAVCFYIEYGLKPDYCDEVVIRAARALIQAIDLKLFTDQITFMRQLQTARKALPGFSIRDSRLMPFGDWNDNFSFPLKNLFPYRSNLDREDLIRDPRLMSFWDDKAIPPMKSAYSDRFDSDPENILGSWLDAIRACEILAELIEAERSNAHAPYARVDWFKDEFGITADALDGQKKRGNMHTRKHGRWNLYSVPDAMRIWPEIVIYLPPAAK